MSRFNTFAVEVDDVLKAYFKKYGAAERKVQSIDDQINKYAGDNSPQAEYIVAKLRVDRKAAQDTLTAVKHENVGVLRDFAAIRSRLETDAESVYCADPAKVDAGTLRLIDSGILSVSEFERLADRAVKDQNFTMLRLIGKGAEEAQETRFKGDRVSMQRLNMVKARANEHSTGAILRSFDQITSAAKLVVGDPYSPSRERSEPNAALYEQWDTIAGAAIEDF